MTRRTIYTGISYEGIDSEKFPYKVGVGAWCYETTGGNYLIHRDILRHQASQRQGTVSTKTRSEVRGGGKKPWRQKGTGRARAGSSRSPLWKGGGVIFGPKPKTVSLKLNKKERKLALQTLFCNKCADIHVLSNSDRMRKTKDFYQHCQKININLNEKVLFIVCKKTLHFKLATQNLKNVELISASNLNTLSLLKAKKIIITPAAMNDLSYLFDSNFKLFTLKYKEIFSENEARN
jgi:large subunit ribosomal protein L4